MTGPEPTPPDPLALDRPDDVRRVRDVLDRAGFDERPILERIGAHESADLSFGPLDRPRVLRRTRQGDPLATLIRLFLAGAPVPLDDFRRAVEPMDPAVWAELGLVEAEGDVRAAVRGASAERGARSSRTTSPCPTAAPGATTCWASRGPRPRSPGR